MDPANARAMVGVWERRCGFTICELPPAIRDSFDRNMASMYADYGVDLTDAAQANAAFAGAYTVLAMLMAHSLIPLGDQQTAIGTVRGLADRSDATVWQDELEAWLKTQ